MAMAIWRCLSMTLQPNMPGSRPQALPPANLLNLPPAGELVGRFFFVADPDGYQIEVLERSGRFK